MKVYDKEIELQKLILKCSKIGNKVKPYMEGKQLIWFPQIFLDYVLKELESQTT